MSKEQLATKILSSIQEYIPSEKLKDFQVTLDVILKEYEINPISTDLVPCNYVPEYVKIYMVSRKIEGVAKSTLEQYNRILVSFFTMAKKNIEDINAGDIRMFLYYNQQESGCSDRTLDLKRTVLCTFFKWCYNEKYITHNPAHNIKPIRYTEKPRVPLSSIEMECIRNACKTVRERALIEILYSTGCRVSELINIKSSDVNFNTGEVLLLGKGNKYRKSFISDKAMFYLKQYLDSRKDENNELFVSDRKPHNPIKRCGIEFIVKNIGIRANLGKPLFPHLFRHTIATDCLSKGMEITDIKEFLGHTNISTTMTYAKLDEVDLKNKHRKITS